MRTLLAIMILISTVSLAAQPLPHSCQEMIAVRKEIFRLKTEHQPTEKTAFQEEWLSFTEVEKLWTAIEKLSMTDPQLQVISQKVQEQAAKEINDFCQQGLAQAKNDFKQIKAELTGE